MKPIITVPESYSYEYIEQHKCRPFIDKLHEKLIVGLGERFLYPIDDSYSVAQFSHTINIFNRFKYLIHKHITSSKLNHITDLSFFKERDIILGCTQYIDNLHIQHRELQVLEGEYNYHTRLQPDIHVATIDTLKSNVPLIISAPFSTLGVMHPQFNEILGVCLSLNIPVHIDCAWYTACKNINIDMMHPAIHSFATSLSKGYGLSGWNRIGIRYVKDRVEDSITVMNDHLQIPSVPVLIGTYFMERVNVDHLWNTHGDSYNKICSDFNLDSTDTIHMCVEDGHSRGIAPLLRYLEQSKDTR